MARKHISFSSQPLADIAKVLRSVANRHGLWQVFRDFVAMSAISLSNAVDKRFYEEREAEYMKIVKRYRPEEANEIAKALALVVWGLEAGMCDFLGSLFMSLELGDAWKGQFFSPYELCLMMAKMTMSKEEAQAKIDRQGFISVNDPCVGGGAMVIAAAHALHDEKINYQQHMHAIAIDVDIVAVHMSYIQFSLLHIPAVIYHGNSLSCEMWSEWKTPAHVLGFWDAKLRRADTEYAATRDAHSLLTETETAIIVPQDKPAEPAIPPALLPSSSINLRNNQLSLF